MESEHHLHHAHVIGPIMSAAEAILHTSSDWDKFDKVTEGL